VDPPVDGRARQTGVSKHPSSGPPYASTAAGW